MVQQGQALRAEDLEEERPVGRTRPHPPLPALHQGRTRRTLRQGGGQDLLLLQRQQLRRRPRARQAARFREVGLGGRQPAFRHARLGQGRAQERNRHQRAPIRRRPLHPRRPARWRQHAPLPGLQLRVPVPLRLRDHACRARPRSTRSPRRTTSPTTWTRAISSGPTSRTASSP